MDMDEFNENKLDWLKKLMSEKNKKYIFSWRNFFNMTANNLLPVISIATKINNIKDTLTNNIYLNRYNRNLVSGNI